jgi:hypothetical protein
MKLPEQHLPRRRRQILDDETRDRNGFNAHEDENSWAQADAWLRDFTARVAGLVRKIGSKN